MSGKAPSEDASRLDWEGEYEKEITEESFKELTKLATWSMEQGSDLYLIGGWASYYYHRGLGSRDIDVIFSDRGIFGRFLSEYYRTAGFAPYGGTWERRFRKTLKAGGRSTRIEIDAAHVDDSPPFREDQGKTLPFQLLESYHNTWRVGPLDVRIPKIELLVLQKAKAWRDRRWDVDHAAVAPLDLAIVQGKIRKDEYDIRNLALHVRSWQTLWSIADKCKSRELFTDSFQGMGVEIPDNDKASK